MELLDGRYQIKKVLGRGGFGTTFLAEDTRSSSGKLCVVKQLQPSFSELYLLTKAKALFKREAETLGILGKHPNIPSLFAYFEENSEFYIVQEYIAGHTLEEELKPNQPLSEQQVIDIVRELLEILSFVHKYNVIHRDIKPTNIIRRKQNNQLVLIDFGSVKKVTKAKQKKGTIVGSYSYISEEQFNGKPNFCSDLYAVGIIGIQAITGIELKQMIGAGFPLTEEGEISWQKHAKVSDKFAYFLSKMVRHNYRYRYQSAKEALQALQEVVETNQIIATNPAKRNYKLSNLPTKMLILSTILVGVMSTLLIAYNIANRQQTLRELSLAGKLTESSLNKEDICQDFSDDFYCEKYLFSGKKGQKIIIEMFSKDFDPYLVLLKSDTNELAVGDNMSLFNWNAQIIVDLPQDGNYIVVARNAEIGASGTYTIRAIKKILE
ncbi:MAG: serine/threonine-protein kinase [Xenococcaceae cyanobacterium MO_188.B29]|nr:serine/threonine-protein kinase [Xenococcaceae cyanobacterium MO_188.B29]